MEGGGQEQEQYIDNAIRAVREKRQVPEIDFTIHQMEDGTQVSTQERVCKGEWRTSRASKAATASKRRNRSTL